MTKPSPIRLLEADARVKEFRNSSTADWADFRQELDAFRIRYSDHLCQGVEEYYCVREGIYLRTLDIEQTSGEPADVFLVKDFLHIIFKMQGRHVFEFNDGYCHPIEPGTMTLVYAEESELLKKNTPCGEPYVAAVLSLTPDVLLAPPFSASAESLPDILQTIVNHNCNARFMHSFAIDMGIRRCLLELFGVTMSGPLRWAYMEAKAIELTCLAISVLSQMEANHCRNKLSPKGFDRLEEIRQILHNQYQAPPSLNELARRAGMSESNLKQRFKALFGTSTSEYAHQIRMSRAMELLSTRSGNVDQIACSLGYDHSCNFITAFKRHYGLTPKAFQKQRFAAINPGH